MFSFIAGIAIALGFLEIVSGAFSSYIYQDYTYGFILAIIGVILVGFGFAALSFWNEGKLKF